MTDTAPTDPTLAEQLGALLTAARTRAGLSRRGLADQLEVADVTLLHYERGMANPTLSKAEALAEQYGLELKVTARRARRRPPVT